MNTILYGLTIAALVSNVLAFLAALMRRPAWAGLLLLLGCAMGLCLFAANWAAAVAPPFGNMRHVLCFFSLTLWPSWYLTQRGKKPAARQLAGYFALAACLALIGALCMPLQAGWRQMPALQSPWFAPHVTSYVISYGLLLVATLLTLRSLFSPAGGLQLPAADAVVRMAFPFMTFGLWSGALWADGVWGGYWAWDIKEVWSLITWLLYIIYLHLPSKSGEPALIRWRQTLLLLAFAALIVTFLVVNLLPKIASVHSYAQ